MKRIALITFFAALFIYVNAQVWKGDLNHFEIEQTSVSLNAPAEKAISYISTPFNKIDNAEWRMRIAMDFNPSSSNYCKVYLFSEQTDLNTGCNAYYLLVGGTKDEVSLFRQDGDEHQVLIQGVDKQLDVSSVLVDVKVTRSKLGEWNLYTSPDSIQWNRTGTAFDNSYTGEGHFGFVCTYTKTRCDKFKFSNIYLHGDAFVDSIPPRVDSLKTVSANSIKVYFNESIKADKIDLKFMDYDGVLSESNIDGSLLTLNLSESFESNKTYTIELSGILDLSGNEMESFKGDFEFRPFEVEQCFALSDHQIYIKTNRPYLKQTDASIALDAYGVNEVSYFSDQEIIVSVGSPFDVGEEVALTINGFTDENAMVLQGNKLFVTWSEPQKGSLVFNEIMADPTPSVALPEAEFIEIYNASDDDLSLFNVELFLEGKLYPLHAMTQLNSGEYLLLCKSTVADTLRTWGNSYAPSTFPALRNSGFSAALLYKNTTLDYVEYSDSLFASDFKKDGGWTAERIDPFYASNKGNWKPSESAPGGTPGRVNSIYGSVLESPSISRLLSYYPVSFNALELVFNERLSELELSNFEVLSESNNLEQIELIKPSEQTVQLQFSTPWEDGVEYFIACKGILDILGNGIEDTVINFSLPEEIQKGEVMFNELMFNTTDDGIEYVELVNTSRKYFNLSDLQLAKRDDVGELSKAYVLSTKNKLFLPGEIEVFYNGTVVFEQLYPFVHLGSLNSLSDFPSLDNTSGKLVLVTSGGSVIDEMQYDEKWHHPMVENTQGVALEKLSPVANSMMEQNWTSASSESGFATPTLPNSHYIEEALAIEEISLSTKEFSPDNDGFHDFVEISVPVAYDGYLCTCNVLNYRGQLVYSNLVNALLGADNKIIWNGYNSDGQRCGLGIYILQLELIHPKGQKFIECLPVAIVAK